MAVILGPPPPLETLLLSLLPPTFLPPRDDEAGRSSVVAVELANWQDTLARTLSQIGSALDDNVEQSDDAPEPVDEDEMKRRLAEGVSRWDLAEGELEPGEGGWDGEEMMDGWIVENSQTRKEIKSETYLSPWTRLDIICEL